jgi:chitinase
VSITSPSAGTTVRGTAVRLTADASAVRGVASVRFEGRPAGSTTWAFLCSTTSAPYACTADSTAAAQGGFELRAVMTDQAGVAYPSAVVAVTVDNTPPRASDVQATNGGTLGRADAGDRVVLTFSDQITLGSIKPGWAGGSTSLSPTFYDKAATGSTNTLRDNLTLGGTNLGTVTVAQNYVNDRAAITYSGSTMVATTATVNGVPVTVVTITLGTPSAGSAAATTATGTMTWTPGAGLLSPDGLAASTVAVNESGTVDQDF